MLERAGGGGGASALSQGQFYLGGGTAVQTACGYPDSPEEMYRFMWAATTTDEEQKLRVFCDDSVAQFDWLEAQGVPFARVAYPHKAVYTRTGQGLLTTGNEKAWPFREQAVPAPRGHQVSGDGDISGGNSRTEPNQYREKKKKKKKIAGAERVPHIQPRARRLPRGSFLDMAKLAGTCRHTARKWLTCWSRRLKSSDFSAHANGGSDFSPRRQPTAAAYPA